MSVGGREGGGRGGTAAKAVARGVTLPTAAIVAAAAGSGPLPSWPPAGRPKSWPADGGLACRRAEAWAAAGMCERHSRLRRVSFGRRARWCGGRRAMGDERRTEISKTPRSRYSYFYSSILQQLFTFLHIFPLLIVREPGRPCQYRQGHSHRCRKHSEAKDISIAHAGSIYNESRWNCSDIHHRQG